AYREILDLVLIFALKNTGYTLNTTTPVDFTIAKLCHTLYKYICGIIAIIKEKRIINYNQ
ncbi:hypothetical protein L9F63_008333, partial [Diploptera punctata]